MNKDVIYIEPEDDITDIVTKIENSKEKIVAIVPPKKADILHSSINVKLMDKAGKNADKKLVLVTTDTAIIKHAASVKMPITKDLQSAPVIPTIEDVDAGLDEEADFDELNNKKNKKTSKSTEEKEEEAITTEEESSEDEPKDEAAEKDESKEESADNKDDKEKKEDKENEDKKADKDKKKKDKKASINWFKKHRMWFFIGVPVVALISLALVWAFIIAPAVDVKVKVRTKVDKFSENITFTTNLEEENIEEGKFYLEEKKVETKNSAKFTATGSKNIGEKAKGNVIVYHYFNQSGKIAINANSAFYSQNLAFYSDEDVEFGWDGNNISECGNNDGTLVTNGCLIFARVNVTAAAPGSEYNIASNNGWTTAADVWAYSDANMTGGTDRTITVVQQSDIDKAKEELLNAEKEGETKNQLFLQISEDNLKIDSTYKLTNSDVVSTPAVGEEVKEGVEPVIDTTTTATIYVIDLTKVREFITKKAKISDKEHIYAIGDPFIENFTTIESGYTGRLKTSYTFGAKLSEQIIVDLLKGQRLGNVNPILKDEGASEVKINPSYPWVTSVPNDINKITINIEEE